MPKTVPESVELQVALEWDDGERCEKVKTYRFTGIHTRIQVHYISMKDCRSFLHDYL